MYSVRGSNHQPFTTSLSCHHKMESHACQIGAPEQRFLFLGCMIFLVIHKIPKSISVIDLAGI